MSDVASPIRTCIGCGARAEPGALVRLRIEDANVVIDRNRRGGRGAWLHPSAACLQRAARRRAFERAFRGAAGSVDVAALGAGLACRVDGKSA